MEAGTKVVVSYGRANPDTGVEYVGTVLDNTDPRAWTGTLAFQGTPTVEQTRAHVAWCESKGLLDGEVPVLWNFPTPRIWWESVKSLVAVRVDARKVA
jgi:hypothetical protein